MLVSVSNRQTSYKFASLFFGSDVDFIVVRKKTTALGPNGWKSPLKCFDFAFYVSHKRLGHIKALLAIELLRDLHFWLCTSDARHSYRIITVSWFRLHSRAPFAMSSIWVILWHHSLDNIMAHSHAKQNPDGSTPRRTKKKSLSNQTGWKNENFFEKNLVSFL